MLQSKKEARYGRRPGGAAVNTAHALAGPRTSSVRNGILMSRRTASFPLTQLYYQLTTTCAHLTVKIDIHILTSVLRTNENNLICF